MVKRIFKWVRQHYFAVINSIAFYPVIIAICFQLAAIALLAFDFSATGSDFKANASWLSLKDSSTARTIIATIAAGILSLSVFSFSMVMILLNQAAGNMSNRILDMMIGNRFHQVVLGFYIGTIVFAFFLLSTIRDVDSGIQIPSISIYILILLTIVDIFLFIYFLHYITQSVKYETIISRVSATTRKAFINYNANERPATDTRDLHFEGAVLQAGVSGYYQGFGIKLLLDFCKDNSYKIHFLHPTGTYLIKGSPMAAIDAATPPDEQQTRQLANMVDIFENRNNISSNPYMGCMQLSEIAIKALSPGINDPGTAILSLNALTDLLAYSARQTTGNTYTDDDGTARIVTTERSFEDFVYNCVWPIWDYGKNDRMMQQAFKNLLPQLKNVAVKETDIQIVQALLNTVNTHIEKQQL